MDFSANRIREIEHFIKKYGHLSAIELQKTIGFSLRPKLERHIYLHIFKQLSNWWKQLWNPPPSDKSVQEPLPLFDPNASFAVDYLNHIQLHLCKEEILCKRYNEIKNHTLVEKVGIIADLIWETKPPMPYMIVAPEIAALYILKVEVVRFCACPQNNKVQ
jgi:hypothetical protein